MTDDELIKACKKYIPCDSCGKSNPQQRCSRCHTVFYCDRDCQTGHWTTHRPDCVDIDEMRAKHAGLGKTKNASKLEPDKHVIEQVLEGKPTCGICLEEDMKNPLVLIGCHHCFCFGCIRTWNDYQGRFPTLEETQESGVSRPSAEPPTCPLCRKEMPNVSSTLIDSAFHHMTVAKLSDTTELESEERCQMAMADIEKFENGNTDAPSGGGRVVGAKGNEIAVNAGKIRAEICILAKDYEPALEIMQDVETRLKIAVEEKKKIEKLMNRADSLRHDERNEEEVQDILTQVQQILETNSGQADPKAHVDACLRVIEIQMLQEDWLTAKLGIQALMMRYPEQNDTTPPQCRQMYSSMSRCTYELEKYDIAIALGEGAIEMNRLYAGCHKFVALAYKATGDAEKAQRAAAQGVVYETPWDENHRMQVRAFYRETFL